ncbi:HNH endonuclease [Pseudomonas sp. OTU5201]|uniref:HNH endonuclease n=1 Tax=Pseudomonas sp. OTU5201 TaxID=3043850 RepID=UPI00313AD601
MKGLNFTSKDFDAIKLAIKEGGKIWESKHVSDVKRKIKDHYRAIQGEQCCYCRKNFKGEFNMVLDIEHVLPQGNSKFKKFMFTITNLSVACKRCNMLVKKDDISFISDTADFSKDPFLSDNYKLIHPNVDNYFHHLHYDASIRNLETMIKYTISGDSNKGHFTYNYFRLNELEVDSFNKSQGALGHVDISSAIDPDIALEIENLLEQ